MDRGAWWGAVHGVAKSQTRLSNFTFTFHFHALEKEMATHSSVLVWRLPGTGEPGGLLSMGSHRVGHDWSDLAAAARVEKSLEVHEYVKHRIIMWSSISPPRHRPQILENRCSNKNVYISVQSSWKIETAQIAINRWADTQKAVYSGIFISHKKGWDSDTCYNMDEPWIHDTQWKKWNIKRLYIVWFHWYEMSWIGKSVERESRWLTGTGQRGE